MAPWPHPIHISVHVSPPHEAALGPELHAVTCLQASAPSFPSSTLTDITGFLTRCSLSLPPPRTEGREPCGGLCVCCVTDVPRPFCWTLSHFPSLPLQLHGATFCAQGPQPLPDRAPLRLPSWTPGEVPAAACRVGGPEPGAHGFLGCTEALCLPPPPPLEGGLGRGEQDTQRPGSCPRLRGGWARQGAATGTGRVWLGLPVGWPAPSWGLSGVLRAEAKRGRPPCPHRAAPGWLAEPPCLGPGKRECRAGWKKGAGSREAVFVLAAGGGAPPAFDSPPPPPSAAPPDEPRSPRPGTPGRTLCTRSQRARAGNNQAWAGGWAGGQGAPVALSSQFHLALAALRPPLIQADARAWAAQESAGPWPWAWQRPGVLLRLCELRPAALPLPSPPSIPWWDPCQPPDSSRTKTQPCLGQGSRSLGPVS